MRPELAAAFLALTLVACEPPNWRGGHAEIVSHSTAYQDGVAEGEVELFVELRDDSLDEAEIRLFAAEVDESELLELTITPATPIVLRADERQYFDVQWSALAPSFQGLCRADIELTFYVVEADSPLEARTRLSRGITPSCF